MSNKASQSELEELVSLNGADKELYIEPSQYIDATAFEKNEAEVTGVNIDGFGVMYGLTGSSSKIMEHRALGSAHWSLMDLHMIGVEPEYAVVYYNSENIDIPEFQSHMSEFYKQQNVMIIGGETITMSDDLTPYGAIAVVGESDKSEVVNLHKAADGEKIVQVVEYGNWFANGVSLADRGDIWRNPLNSDTFEAARIARKYASGMKDAAYEGPVNILSDIAGASGQSVHVDTEEIIYNEEAKEMVSRIHDSHIDFLTELDGFTFYATVPDESVEELQEELSDNDIRSSVVGELGSQEGVYIDGEQRTLPLDVGYNRIIE